MRGYVRLSLAILLLSSLAWLPGRVAARRGVPLVTDDKIVLPAQGVVRSSLSYWTWVPGDSLGVGRLARLLALAAAGRVAGPPGNGQYGDGAGPQIDIDWATGHEAIIRTSVYSDTVGIMIEVPKGDYTWRGIVAPGLRDTLLAELGCGFFAFHGTGAIRRLEFRNWRGAFSVDGGADLDSLARGLEVTVASIPSSCPFCNLLRLEGERGVLFGALAADGDAALVLAAAAPRLEAAWRDSVGGLGSLITRSGTECSITRRARAAIERLVHAHGLPVDDQEEEEALRQQIIEQMKIEQMKKEGRL